MKKVTVERYQVGEKFFGDKTSAKIHHLRQEFKAEGNGHLVQKIADDWEKAITILAEQEGRRVEIHDIDEGSKGEHEARVDEILRIIKDAIINDAKYSYKSVEAVIDMAGICKQINALIEYTDPGDYQRLSPFNKQGEKL